MFKTAKLALIPTSEATKIHWNEDNHWFFSKKTIVGSGYHIHIMYDDKTISSTDKSLKLPGISNLYCEQIINEYNKHNYVDKVMVEYEEKIIHECYSNGNTKGIRSIIEVPKISPKTNKIKLKLFKLR